MSERKLNTLVILGRDERKDFFVRTIFCCLGSRVVVMVKVEVEVRVESADCERPSKATGNWRAVSQPKCPHNPIDYLR